MRQAAGLVFDEIISGTASEYTSTELNEFLGSADHLALHVVTDEVFCPQGTLFELGVQIETSADGTNWATKAATPEVLVGLGMGFTGVGPLAYDTNALPSMRFVRLHVTSTAPSNARAHVRVYVTLRDTGGRGSSGPLKEMEPPTP